MENEIAELLKEKQETSDKANKELYPTGSIPVILYGLCKIHKSTVDGVRHFRPILPAKELINSQKFFYRYQNHQRTSSTPLKLHFHFVKKLSFLLRIQIWPVSTPNCSSLTFPYEKRLTLVFKSYLSIKIISMVCQKTLFVTVTMSES